jgi:hypothetical protein
MSLHPVKFHFPFQIDAGATKAFTIEDEIETASFILSPTLRYYNTLTAGTVDLTVVHLLDMSFGDDPLNSGTASTTLLSVVGLAKDAVQDVVLLTQIDLDTEIATRHTVTVVNNSAAQEVVRFVLYGYTEIDSILPGGSVVVKSFT